MPFLAREHERVALGGGEGVHLLDGAAEDILLDALALAVEVAQLAGEPLGLGGVLREQELGGQLRAAMRPAALMRGARTKPICTEETGRPVRPASRSSA